MALRRLWLMSLSLIVITGLPAVLNPPPVALAVPDGELARTLLPVKLDSRTSEGPLNSPTPESARALPDEPGGAVALTLLLFMTSSLRTSGPSAWRPPENATA